MEKLILTISLGDYLIDTTTIVRVEASSNYSKLFLSDGNVVLTAKLLRWFENRLQPKSFTHLHCSHLINNDFLQTNQCINKQAMLKDGINIPISNRRKKLVLQKLAACFLFFITSLSVFSQSVGIGTNTPHASAQLDVVSNNKGLSIPSMTTAQRLAIASPKAGLFVFDTDKQTLCMFNGNNWVYFQNSIEPNVIQPIEQVADDGVVGDEFGCAVAIDGNYAIIGARYDNIGANADQGSAYIFIYNGSGWVQQAKLTASNGLAGDNFGYSVSISGDYVIIGAPMHDIGASADRGSAYIFIRSGTNWTQQSVLPAIGLQAGDNFGHSVSIDGNYCVVGSPGDDVGANSGQGTAFFFVRSVTTWTQQDYVTLPSGAAGDNFGTGVSINGIFAAVGAPYDDGPGGYQNGSAHIFRRVVNSWSHEQALTYSSDSANFGYSLSIYDSSLVAGAPYLSAFSREGNARAFRLYPDGIWDITANGFFINGMPGGGAAIITTGAEFGRSVCVNGLNMIIGAPFNDHLLGNKGDSYLYQSDGTDWYYVRMITDPVGGVSHWMGSSVAVYGNKCIVGAPGANGQKGKVLFLNL